MRAQKSIRIVGGGLAGLTLGIALRQRGAPVTIYEAGKYPRHRVCGEFISGHGQQVLEQLGLDKILFRAGAIEAHTARFFARKKAMPLRTLPQPAICLSRFELDAALANHFQQVGGELRESERFREHGSAEGVVHASGRRAHPLENGWRWFGLKIHARNMSLDADLELHLTRNSYIGLCRLRDGIVNVCGLFRRRIGQSNAHENGSAWLRGKNGSLLAQKLKDAEFDESSFCAVAGLPMRAESAASSDKCRIGDAITMIPPLTGNGMSMAIESAAVAVEPLLAWSRGEISWASAQQIVAFRCDELFAPRLRWATWMQRLMLSPICQGTFVRTFGKSEFLWRRAFERTR